MVLHKTTDLQKMNPKCQSFKPVSKGILLLLVWSILLSAAGGIIVTTTTRIFFLTTKQVMMWTGPWVLLPVAGWMGDSFLGRYRAIVVGVFATMLSFLILLCATVMLQFNWTPIPAIATVLYLYMFVIVCSMGNVYANTLPFIIDQMIGASADDISAIVQWSYWSLSLGISVSYFVASLPIEQLQQYTVLVISLTMIFLCLSSVLITDCLCHKWLDIHYKSSSPFKTIFKVLNYARKTKYPEHRSAFTYIDEEEPSRLDYGKNKFGGPFTEEEVEDVKTLFRLLPFFLSSFGASISINSKIHDYKHVSTILHVDLHYDIIIGYLLPLLLIPAYRFIVLPLLHNRIPSLIKRVGAGLVIMLVGNLLNLTVDTFEHLHSNNTQCMFSDTSHGSANSLSIPLHWLLISASVSGVGQTFVVCSSLEFVMAQSPNRMRGVMMGLATVFLGFGCLALSGLEYILGHFSNAATPSCGFYYYLVLSILLILSLVLFTIAAKRYKLRERDRHVNIQAIAEEHYERYLDQEEEYMREAANMYKNKLMRSSN